MTLSRSQRQLAEAHATIASKIAWRLIPRLPSTVEWEEIHAAALEGICQAARSWDASVGPFPAFAVRRAYGAAIDSLRSADHLPLRIRSIVKAGEPLPEEWEHVNVDEPLSLDAPVRAGDEAVDLRETVASGDDTETELAARETIKTALDALNERDRRLLVAEVVTGLSQRELAEEEGVSENRIGQILSRARLTAFQALRRAA